MDGDGNIENCYVSGTIKTYYMSKGVKKQGISAGIAGGAQRIKNSYSLAEEVSATIYLGGCKTQNCYFDQTNKAPVGVNYTENQITSEYYYGAQGVDAAYFTSAKFLKEKLGWDSEIWGL